MYAFFNPMQLMVRTGAAGLLCLGLPARADLRATIHNRTEAALVIVRSKAEAGPWTPLPFLPEGALPAPGHRAVLGLVNQGESLTVQYPDRAASLEAELTVHSLPGPAGFVFGELAILSLASSPLPPDGIYPEPEAPLEGPWSDPLKGLPRPWPALPGPEPEPEDALRRP